VICLSNALNVLLNSTMFYRVGSAVVPFAVADLVRGRTPLPAPEDQCLPGIALFQTRKVSPPLGSHAAHYIAHVARYCVIILGMSPRLPCARRNQQGSNKTFWNRVGIARFQVIGSAFRFGFDLKVGEWWRRRRLHLST
jgi:hypothetical protein